MRFIVLLYALIVLAGGLTGFLKAGSYVSLMAGLSFGGLLLLSFFVFKRKWGPYLALVITFILDAFFTQKYLQTLKFMPSGMLSLLSLAVLISLAFFIRRNSKH
jgi:uncharacterized membrane protein (UPF0136 family)